MILWVYDRWGNQIDSIGDIILMTHEDEIGRIDVVQADIPGQRLEKGNRFLWRDQWNEWHEHIVASVDTKHELGAIYQSVYAENSISELNLEYKDDERCVDYTSRLALEKLLSNTRWDIGICENTVIADVTYYHCTVFEGLQLFIERFGGEIDTTITVNENGVVSRKLNYYKQRGEDNGLLFTYGYDMDQVERVVDLDDVVSRLHCFGSGIPISDDTGELTGGFTRRITFSELNDGKDYLDNNAVRESWGILTKNGTKKHAEGIFIAEMCDDPAELLILGAKELERRSQPRISYSANVVLLADAGLDFKNARTGDTCYLRDEPLDFRGQGRVVQIIRYVVGGMPSQITVGNVVRSISNTVIETEKGLAQLQGRTTSWNNAAVADRAWLNNWIQSVNNAFDVGGSYQFSSFELGTIWSNVQLAKDLEGNILPRPAKRLDYDGNPAMAIQLKGGGFRIANSLTSDGEFNWRTFGTGDGFVADEIVAGVLWCGDNYIDLNQGVVSFNNGIITDKAGKNFWNLGTSTLRISTDSQIGDSTIGGWFNDIEDQLNDLDGALGDLDKDIRDAVSDGIVTEAEAAAVAKLLQRIQTEQVEAISSYNTIYNSTLLKDTTSAKPKSTLLNAKNALYGTTGTAGKYGDLVSAINKVISCTTSKALTDAMKVYNNAYTAYQSTRLDFTKALDAAQKAITEAYANGAAEDAAQTAVDRQTQQQIFNKLTNNSTAQGIYLEKGVLYINAEYLRAGIITDKPGNNKWDLTRGELTTKKGNIGGFTIESNKIYNNSIELNGDGITLKYNNTIVGYIGTNYYAGSPNSRALNFDLDGGGTYMSWASRSGTSGKFAIKLAYTKSNLGQMKADRINLGCDFDGNGQTIYNTKIDLGTCGFSTPGITGKSRNFSLPTSIDKQGNIQGWVEGCFFNFKNGILIGATF